MKIWEKKITKAMLALRIFRKCLRILQRLIWINNNQKSTIGVRRQNNSFEEVSKKPSTSLDTSWSDSKTWSNFRKCSPDCGINDCTRSPTPKNEIWHWMLSYVEKQRILPDLLLKSIDCSGYTLQDLNTAHAFRWKKARAIGYIFKLYFLRKIML